MSFLPKDSVVSDRENKVQRLVIPFTITANATPASVVLKNDEPSLMFMKSQGVDQITAADSSASFSIAPNDANGIMNILVKCNQSVSKVMQANVKDRVNGGSQPAKLGDADGLSPNGNIMITMDSSQDFSTTSADYCLELEFILA